MSSIFDLTHEEISLLSDEDLRSLIGLLCEADYSTNGLSISGIYWSGHQNAPDGGLDVVVNQEINPPSNSYIPNKRTGFQVKAEKFSKRKIEKEMSPNGNLRDEIRELIKYNGAYIIVSSKDSTSYTSLKARLKAMSCAIEGETNSEGFIIDFFDQGRIASWVRNHPSLIHWVKEKNGSYYSGWQPYKNWSNPSGGIYEKYLSDEKARVIDTTSGISNEFSIEKGLDRIRLKLSQPGGVVRLVGLSGVGKTRFVQALFDETIGENPLNPYLVHYTDVSDNPSPTPIDVINAFNENRTRAIIIIDNCPPEIHRKVTSLCKVPNSCVNLVTIEYDVRDDIPEKTDVYILKTGSSQIISNLIKLRFPHITNVDSQRIARFADGNARLGLALANTVQKGDSISSFRDQDLFNRLFWQRNQPDKELLQTAEVFSLVYSFDSTYSEDGNSELDILSILTDRSTRTIYGSISDLENRDLIQKRGIWRALLPHALANRLSKQALSRIPKVEIIKAFFTNNQSRITKSFLHRLSYLHDSNIAISIANEILSPQKYIDKSSTSPSNLDMDIIGYLASISPQKTLELFEFLAIHKKDEFFDSDQNNNYYEFMEIIRKIGYEPEFFSRSINLLCEFFIENKGKKVTENRNYHETLHNFFHLHLSGTNASVEQREEIIKGLLQNPNLQYKLLGISLINSALKTVDFSSTFFPEFGARKRDFGLSPRTLSEITNWYITFLNIILQEIKIHKNSALENEIRNILANRFRELLNIQSVYQILFEISTEINNIKNWGEGWIALLQYIQFSFKRLSVDEQDLLLKLEQEIRPRLLSDQAKILIFTDNYFHFWEFPILPGNDELDELFRDKYATNKKIGIEVGQIPEEFQKLKGHMVTSNNYHADAFGEGLSIGCKEKKSYFMELLHEFDNTERNQQTIHVILGYVHGLSESSQPLCDEVLDVILEDSEIGRYYPYLQLATTINKKGINRILKSIDLGIAPIIAYKALSRRNFHDEVSLTDFLKILTRISIKDDGIETCLEILQMKYFYIKDKNEEIPEKLNLFTIKIIISFISSNTENISEHFAFIVGDLVKNILDKNDDRTISKEILRQLKKSFERKNYIFSTYRHLLTELSASDPISFLDEFLTDLSLSPYDRRIIFDSSFTFEPNPVDKISEKTLLEWANTDPDNRYSIILSTISTFIEKEDNNEIIWKPIVLKIMESSTNKSELLEILYDSIIPKSWSGRRSLILQKRRVLLENLLSLDSDEIKSLAPRIIINYDRFIQNQISFEEKEFNEERSFE